MDEAHDADPLCGQEIANGRYLVERVLGKGGMGTVYVAVQRPINRKVALKLIHRELVGNREIVGRFLQEMRLTATIEHPHTVRLYDFGDIGGQPFLTTELLAGRTLRDELNSVGAFPQTRLCNVGAQIAKALRAAHAQGVVHRDLKPDNIMLLDSYGERDYVKVLDFGIARCLTQQTANDPHTQTGMLLGTPAYMSPEQCEGRAIDGRSDLYSLGIVLFELAAGTPPFSPGHTLPQLLMDHVASPPPDIRSCAGLAEPVAALIMAMLAKRPEERPASAEAVVAAFAPFTTVATGSELPAGPLPSGPSPRPASPTVPLAETAAAPAPARATVPHAAAPAARPARRGWLVAAVAAVLLLGAIGAFYLMTPGTPVSPAAIADALAAVGEPPFPAACVSADHRPQILAAATGKAGWSAVPATAVERILVDARKADPADAELRARLESAVARCPSSAALHALLGKVLARVEQDDAAIAQLQSAVELAPRYTAARFNLAVALVKQRRETEALPLVTEVLADEPDHAGARLLRGQARMTTGDRAGAVDDFKAYTAAQPQAGPVWALLGEVLAQSGDREAARAAFCRAAELGVERARARCERR